MSLRLSIGKFILFIVKLRISLIQKGCECPLKYCKKFPKSPKS